MKYIIVTLLFISFGTSVKADLLRVGYSTSITNVTEAKMKAAKLAGVDCLEVSLNGFINKEDLTLNKTDAEIEVILFHPSYFLGLNEREARTLQFIKSVTELNEEVKKIGAFTVIENMTGFELVMKDGKRERPLMRTVEETVELFNRLPKDVYAAIDLNHIIGPEKLILAMGKRLKTLHVADGDGKNENHFFPCDRKGGNDWVAIIRALKKVNYKGPFLYESKPKELSGYKECYLQLVEQAK